MGNCIEKLCSAEGDDKLEDGRVKAKGKYAQVNNKQEHFNYFKLIFIVMLMTLLSS